LAITNITIKEKITGDLTKGNFTGNQRPETLFANTINDIIDSLNTIKSNLSLINSDIQGLSDELILLKLDVEALKNK